MTDLKVFGCAGGSFDNGRENGRHPLGGEENSGVAEGFSAAQDSSYILGIFDIVEKEKVILVEEFFERYVRVGPRLEHDALMLPLAAELLELAPVGRLDRDLLSVEEGAEFPEAGISRFRIGQVGAMDRTAVSTEGFESGIEAIEESVGIAVWDAR